MDVKWSRLSIFPLQGLRLREERLALNHPVAGGREELTTQISWFQFSFFFSLESIWPLLVEASYHDY